MTGNNPPYKAWRVKEEFTHVMPPSEHFKGYDYPIFTDDELRLDSIEQVTLTGYFTKVAPGLALTHIAIPMELVEEYEETRRWVIS